MHIWKVVCAKQVRSIVSYLFLKVYLSTHFSYYWFYYYTSLTPVLTLPGSHTFIYVYVHYDSEKLQTANNMPSTSSTLQVHNKNQSHFRLPLPKLESFLLEGNGRGIYCSFPWMDLMVYTDLKQKDELEAVV